MSSVGSADPGARVRTEAADGPKSSAQVIGFSAAAFLVLSVTQWAPWLLAGLVPRGALATPAAAVAGGAVFAATAVWFRRRVLAARGRGLGLSGDVSGRARLFIGLVVGPACYAAVFGARLAAGAVTVEGVRGAGAVVGVVLTGLVVAGYQAVSEEVVFRGALMGLLPRSLGPVLVVVISVMVFVVYHAPKWESLVRTPFAIHLALAGTAFAVAYLRTGSLWLGIGLHTGWNLGAYGLLEAGHPVVVLTGPPVSGWDEPAGWLAVAGNAVLLLAAVRWPVEGDRAR